MNSSSSSRKAQTERCTTSSLSLEKARNSAIIHPILLEASDLINDSTWKTLLLDASMGKLPEDFSISPAGLLVHKKKAAGRVKYTKRKLPDNALDCVEVFIEFLKRNGRIYSECDMESMSDTLSEAAKTRSRGYKGPSDIILQRHFDRYKEKWNLNDDDALSYANSVTLGVTRSILQNYIRYDEEGEIEKIGGIVYERDAFRIDPCIIVSKPIGIDRLSPPEMSRPYLLKKKKNMTVTKKATRDEDKYESMDTFFDKETIKEVMYSKRCKQGFP